MTLNYIWISFFIIAFITALIKAFILGDLAIFKTILDSLFSMSKTAFEISIGLTGIMAFWLGIMRVAEKAGAIKILAIIVAPFFTKIFPDVPKDHPAMGSILMNFSANMLGLDNAATPLGLKAMKELQNVNPDKETASDSQIMFLVLNTSSIMLIPITIMALRGTSGAENPADVFIPILIATFCSSLAGLIVVSIYQKINLFQPILLATLAFMTTFIVSTVYFASSLSQDELTTGSAFISGFIIFSIIIIFLGLGLRSKLNIYTEFVEGAKEGFKIAVDIIPFLVAMLVALAVFRASGALDFFVYIIAQSVQVLGFDTRFVDSLPTAFMKPFSGSGSRALMLEAIQTHGADSFTGRLSSILQGSTETTFYIIAVYFGSVKIKFTRYAVTCGLIADLVGIISAIFVAYLFFG